MDQMDRELALLVTQESGRVNDADVAQVTKKRPEPEDVDAYLQSRRWRYSSAVQAAHAAQRTTHELLWMTPDDVSEQSDTELCACWDLARPAQHH